MNLPLAICRPSLIGITLLTFILVACGPTPESHRVAQPQTWQLPLLTITSGVPIEYSSIGSVISDKRINVSSRLSGYIQNLDVKEGQFVHTGELLAQINAPNIDGNISTSKATLALAEADFQDAKTDVLKFTTLFKNGSISDIQLRKARLRQDSTKEAVNRARASLKTAYAQRIYAEIRSPIEGMVVDKIQRTGDLANPGSPILTLEADQDLLFETFITENQVGRITINDAVTVHIDGISSPLLGQVSRLVRSGDSVTRSYLVKISLPPTNRLMPGMFGRASFLLGEDPTPVLPARLLIERGGLKGVFVVDSNGYTHFRWLRIGREWQGQLEITAGLKAGEQVVDAIEPTLREGDIVTMVPNNNRAKNEP